MNEQEIINFDDLPVIKGFPELRWTGKRPYKATQYYPAQDEWINKIYYVRAFNYYAGVIKR